MMRSLWAAASGMKSQQTSVDTIANNLANVNTTGYKTEVNEFKSLLYQTIQTKTTSANGENKPVDVVIRPEDVEMTVIPENVTDEEIAAANDPSKYGRIQGVVTHLIFKGVHYEMEVMANGFEWLVHSTSMFAVGQKVGINVDPFNIQIMNKPESEDEEAVGVEE